jgi:hypothetical protein
MIVAATRSRFGGQLNCGHIAARGELIFKITTRDKGTTSAGNGRGAWICTQCAAGAEGESA